MPEEYVDKENMLRLGYVLVDGRRIANREDW